MEKLLNMENERDDIFEPDIVEGHLTESLQRR